MVIFPTGKVVLSLLPGSLTAITRVLPYLHHPCKGISHSHISIFGNYFTVFLIVGVVFSPYLYFNFYHIQEKSQVLNHRLLLEKIGRGTTYLFSDFEDIVMRAAIVDGELEVYIKYRRGREFKAVYDSKLVGMALSSIPEIITKEQYDLF